MNYQEKILEFLQQPENLPVALEVVRHVDALRPHLHRAFWTEIGAALNQRLSESPCADRWVIDNEGSFDQTYRNVKIRIKSLPATFKGSHLVVGLMQERAPSYAMLYGLLWAVKDRPAPEIEAFHTLLHISKEAGFSEKDSNSWWPRYHYLNLLPRSDEFILDYGLQPTVFIDELADKIWDYFIKLEPALYQLNQEVFQGQ